MSKPLSVLLVDPSLFTGPYDAALTHGLIDAGIQVRWVGRPLRAGEKVELPQGLIDPLYYRGVQETAKNRGAVWKLRKAASHILGGLRLLGLGGRTNFQLIHVQWAVIPAYDAVIMQLLRRRKPVIITVHDIEPFNGSPTSKLQTFGFHRALGSASRIIVHTQNARRILIEKGHSAERVVVVPHGPLSLAAPPKPRPVTPHLATQPWRIVLFGKLQPYKGLDVLIAALALMTQQQQSRLQVVVAGEPLFDLEPLLARIGELGLDRVIELRLKRLDEDEMADLFDSADAFVFPYRQIEASGVLHLILPYGRWIIASDLGAFKEFVTPDVNGARIAPGDPQSLSQALLASIGRTVDADHQTSVTGWNEIGRLTRAVYESALGEHQARRG